ncbi:MAG: GNAT family N-acetyltransferase, partial [Actinomycetota bacterium]|nr:GNAT family N-acetyltransferase [Actinomycetota bacterium]
TLPRVATDAWREASDAARSAGVELRPLDGLDDAELILDVMIATWGEHQLIPRELIRALQESGNVPWGAFADEALIGYVMGFLGNDADGPHVHSHMLAVRPGRRSKGVGYALKMAQRAQALDVGVLVVRWTYDPMLARNAYFNLQKLGGFADRFHRDFYGEMGDLLNRGDRSDRFVVRWDLDRFAAMFRQPDGRSVPVLGRSDDESVHPERVGDPRVEGDLVGAIVEIPPDYPELRNRKPDLAREWRDACAQAFEDCFAVGMVAVELDRTSSSYMFVAGPGIASWQDP